MDEKVTMRDEKESFKDVLHKITKKYESAKLELNENETHSQVGVCVARLVVCYHVPLAIYRNYTLYE